jgi:endonuclease/exonuclease/phosphatase (EEP) superfamily protein YafD
MRKLWRAGPAVLSAGLLLAIAIRWTVRDRIPGIATLYYVTPLPALALGAVVTAAWWLQTGRRRASTAAIAAALALAGGYVGNSWSFAGPRKTAGASIRVVFWNVAQGSWGRDRLGPELLSSDGDIIGLVEAGNDEAFWRTSLPGYQVRLLSGGILLATRGEILETQLGRLAAGKFSCGRVSVGGREVRLVVVDIDADPMRHRGPVLEEVRPLADRWGAQLVMGDFNTPRDSALLGGLRSGYEHAFESAGHGLDATWPMPVPVLAIDHLWIRRDGQARLCTHQGSCASDHRRVVAEVVLP